MFNYYKYKILGIICLFLVLVGCTVAVKTTTPTPDAMSILESGKISEIEVNILQSMNEDRVQILESNDVPKLIKTSMTESLNKGGYFAPSGRFKCNILISNFMMSQWGAGTQVTLMVTVTESSTNEKVKRFEAKSYSIRTNAPAMTAIFSDATQKVLEQL